MQFEAEPPAVSQAREFVADAAREAGLPLDRINDARLLATEAVTNAIQAHQELPNHGSIHVQCSFDADEFRITVTDDAGGFDPEEVTSELEAPADLDREGGYGLAIIEALSDEVSIDSSEEGTEVRAVVYRRQS